MSRRPRTVHEQRVARSLRTMAPGGRLASESPVRRPRFTGGAPSTAQATFVATASQSGDRGIYWYAAREAGDRLIAVAIARTSVTAPSGWTSLLTGNVGSCYYCIAYGTSVGGSAFQVEGTFSGSADCSIYGWAVRDGATPSLDYSATTAGATSGSYGSTAGSGALPVQLLGLCSVDGTAGSVSGYQDPDYSAYAFTYKGATGTNITGTFPDGVGDPDGPFPGACAYLTPGSCDFISAVVST